MPIAGRVMKGLAAAVAVAMQLVVVAVVAAVTPIARVGVEASPAAQVEGMAEASAVVLATAGRRP